MKLTEREADLIIDEFIKQLENWPYFSCPHCPLVVRFRDAERMTLRGTSDFPECTGACRPKGCIDARSQITHEIPQK